MPDVSIALLKKKKKLCAHTCADFISVPKIREDTDLNKCLC